MRSWAFTLPKHSPYLELVNYSIDQLKETGALERILKKWKPLPPMCEDKTGKPLGFRSCLSCFLVMISGFLVGTIILGIEVLLPKITRK